MVFDIQKVFTMYPDTYLGQQSSEEVKKASKGSPEPARSLWELPDDGSDGKGKLLHPLLQHLLPCVQVMPLKILDM